MIDTVISSYSVVVQDTLLEINQNFHFETNSESKSWYEQQWLSSAITILLGLFAGLIAIWQVRLNIQLNAKQKWKEALRDATSKYVAEVQSCTVTIKNMEEYSKEKIESKSLRQKKQLSEKIDSLYNDSYLLIAARIDQLGSIIQLHLDASTTLHESINSKIETINAEINKEEWGSTDLKSVQKLLKDVVGEIRQTVQAN